MDLDEGTVHGDGFERHAEDLRVVQRGNDAIPHPALGPTIHARLEGGPVAESLGEPAPWAPLLGHGQDGMAYVPMVERHGAAWGRHTRRDWAIRCGGEFQVRRIAYKWPLVLPRPSWSPVLVQRAVSEG